MWTQSTLGESCKMYQPKTISAKEMISDGEYVVFGANGIIGRYDKYNHAEPQLLVTCRGATCGSVNISQPNSWITGNAMVIQPDTSKISMRYMEYVCRGGIDLSQAITGAAQPQITRKSLEPIEFSYPPLAEQQRIVTKLDAVFGEIERAIELTNKARTQIELLLETALNEITNISGVQVQLMDVCKIKSSLINPSNEPYSNQYHIGAGNIVSMSNEVVNVLTAKEEKLTSGKYPFDEHAVLYSKIRPYLRKVHLPNFVGICSADMYPLTPTDTRLNRNFLFYLLLSKHFTDYAIAGSARAGMPKVNQNHLFAYKFVLPAIAVQCDFVNKMDSTFTKSKLAIDIYQRRCSKLLSLKSAILKQELQPTRSDAA